MIHPIKKTSMAIIILIFIAVICLSIFIMPIKAYADSYNVGDIGPAGGYIIYANGTDYLEAAPTDQASIYKWSNITSSLAGADGVTIGTGQSNTNIIINQHGPSGSSAAQICDDLVITNNGIDYDDWYLPSVNELQLTHYLWELGKGDFNGKFYWSSTEKSNTYVRGYYNNSNWSGELPKDAWPTLVSVRAIRSFSLGSSIKESEKEAIEPLPWVRDHEMTCYQVWINENNDFEFVFWWEYKNNNWVKIYDMAGNEVFSIDMEKGNAHFEADLPDGFYTVKTFHDGFETPIQEFLIGKP